MFSLDNGADVTDEVLAEFESAKMPPLPTPTPPPQPSPPHMPLAPTPTTDTVANADANATAPPSFASTSVPERLPVPRPGLQPCPRNYGICDGDGVLVNDRCQCDPGFTIQATARGETCVKAYNPLRLIRVPRDQPVAAFHVTTRANAVVAFLTLFGARAPSQIPPWLYPPMCVGEQVVQLRVSASLLRTADSIAERDVSGTTAQSRPPLTTPTARRDAERRLRPPPLERPW